MKVQVRLEVSGMIVQHGSIRGTEPAVFYYAEQGDSETEKLAPIRNAIRSTTNRFILDTTVLNEQDDTGASRGKCEILGSNPEKI
ncbi:hypothetical protein [Granulicella sp. S156]|uniref:hypothetical protein n=1 Tax=Granulicella sp. S156 TaxID=1747224 RepID=UPI00131D23BD|nr:hypothetical protein [Granulicella sp. S156]